MNLKLFILIISTTVLSLIVSLIFNFSVYKDLKEDDVKYDILKKANFLATQVYKENINKKKFQLSVATLNEFKKPDWVDVYLIKQSGEVHTQSSGKVDSITDILPEQVIKKINKSQLMEGVLQNDGNIYSYSFLGEMPYWVLAVGKSNLINRPYFYYFIRTLVSLVLIGCLLWIVSRLASKKVVSDIEQLSNSFTKFGEGELESRAKVKSKDEVGKLSIQFNKMADQINKLIYEQKNMARMEQELKSAKRVQEYFLPQLSFKNNNFEISGYYEPASECGGDWWFYESTNEHLILCVGDVTGHGSAAAMLTSSCRSLFSVLMKNKIYAPEEILKQMSDAIYDTVKGDLLMTMIVLKFDFVNNKLTYANASHEAPIYWDKNNPPKNKNEFKFLTETHGRRLGETPEQTYSQTEIDLPKNTGWCFYSDGIMELKDLEDQQLGEREMMKYLVLSTGQASTDQYLQYFKKQLQDYRKGQALEDDLSYLFMST
ncbi:MAG: SpoIIE family protein phosphatase [Bdellovibrionales bacterium]|nr:SpoIIE family protein phosphatase [Bdellovibrionales bacterium]